MDCDRLAAMDANLLSKYARAVPRYTSYPTAPQFHAGVGADDYRRWLAEVPAEAPLSIYVHIPFCDSMCWFCGCNTKIVRRYRPIAAFFETLLKEIDLAVNVLGSGRPVSHIHWGGGTPNMLAPADILALSKCLGTRFEFRDGMEFAVELDPRTLTREAVAALAEAGVTRASLGVQDLNPDVQQAINRIQPFEMTAEAIAWLRQDGVTGINVDLMYGLPGQTVAGMETNVDRILTLAPDRLALFGYAHVPWMKRHQRLIDEAALPDPAERSAQSKAAAARLQAAGYRAIGLDHFARPGDPLAAAAAKGQLHRNFQGYTIDEATALIGFGPSAIGALPAGYVQNATPINDWRNTVEGGNFAVVRGVAIDADDRLRRTIIERLMCDMGVDLAKVCAAFDCPPRRFAPELARLAPMAADGIIDLDGFRICVRDRGRPLLRSVAAVFDRYLEDSAGRHSQAV